MLFNVVTFGCKVNQYESNMMKEVMLRHNFLYTDNLDMANIIIVNTCTVTNIADKKCLKMIRRLKRENPNAILVVTGCSTQYKQEDYQKLDIDVLIGNNDKSIIADLINEYLSSKKQVVRFNNERNLEFENMEISDFNHVRAFIKIEDGCDNFCSYCIIPYVRGHVRSKEFPAVIKEANSLVAHGHKEIVLTGIHTGRYAASGKNLADLIRSLAEIDDLVRIRVSSIEVSEITPDFLQLLETEPKLCSHLHIPLQAGSDEVLKKMNRKYDLKYYEEKIAKIRSIRPDIAISTDIIVGHPYETDELFLQTIEFAKKMQFSKIHVFPYSMRVGTAASLMPQVDETTKKKRVKELIALSTDLEQNYYNQFKGKTLDVLIEVCDNGISVGHTSNYLTVRLREQLEVGRIYRIRI